MEPRLSGGFSDAPCRPVADPRRLVERASCSPLPEAALRDVLGRLRDRQGEVPAAIHHARGLALLVGADSERVIDRAVADLAAAARLEPEGCRWSDLAAGYIVRAQVRDDPRDLVRALSAVVRSEASGTCVAEARFNRALILKRFWLDGEARETVEASPQEAREHAYGELLGRWGDAILAGRRAEAEEALNRADAVGRALREIGGDETLEDAVRSIRGSAGSIEELARAHRAYRDGIQFFRRLDFEAAGPRFAEARERFARSGSPAQLWAEVGAAGLDLYAGRYEQAIRGFREIDRRADPKRHRALRGRAQWGVGLAYARQGLWAESVRPYEEAGSHFEAAREQENLGASYALLAEALRFLGQADAAWRARARAFRELRRFPVSRRLHNLLWESADACLDEGEPEAALVLQDEGVRVAERSGDPVILAEALVRRSRVLLERGDADGARAELHEAKIHNEKGKGAATRGRIAADIDYAQGEILRRDRPERALEPLGRAVEEYGRRKLPLNLAAALLSRARAHLALEHGEKAEADLAAAIDLFERQQLALTDDALRLSFLDTAQGLFDEMILLQYGCGSALSPPWSFPSAPGPCSWVRTGRP